MKLAVFVSDKVPDLVMGDPGRFRQIVTNLVGNSIKFTERGHIFVKVHVVEHSKTTMREASVKQGSEELTVLSGDRPFKTLSGREAADERNYWDTFRLLIAEEGFRSDYSDRVTLMVCIEDTGIGIPVLAQDRIFTPFMQADSSMSRHYGGTGIGLSISKCLVERMGGQINFVSRPRIGSTFSFTAVFERCSKSNLSAAKKAISGDLPSGFKGMKAVLVDGKPVRAAVTSYHLKRLGILVEVASSMKMAVSLCGKNGSLVPG